MNYYRPQRSWGKVKFLQVPVILFTGGSASVHAGIPPPRTRQPPPPDQASPLGPGTPPDQAPPRTRPPGTEHAGRYSQRAGGTHPTGMQSCSVNFFPETII